MRNLAIAAMLAAIAGNVVAATPVDLAAIKDWDIVVDANALPAEAYAAAEFQRFFEQAGGGKLPIVTSTDRADRHVFIGPSAAMSASSVAFSTAGLGTDDLRIMSDGRNIAIAGGRPRGTLYGVYAFLDDYLGVRFLTADHTHVPKLTATHSIGPLDRSYHPPLELRISGFGESRDAAFAARLRGNSFDGKADEKLGGKPGVSVINHSFGQQAPSQKYGKDHPEYYAMIDGVRRSKVDNDGDGRGTELCLTNPEVLRIVTDSVLDDLAKHPGKRNISVSQNDNTFNCRCPACEAVEKAEGSAMGTQLAFVNAVADAVAAKFPGVMVGTLAYKYTRRPPKTLRPRPNVQIQLCNIECCQIHAIDDPQCPKNAEFYRDLTQWGQICRNIYIWTYSANFQNYLLPYPNLPALGANLRCLIANGAKGVFVQGSWNAMGADMSDLRNYVTACLLWDPNRDGQKLADEFLDLHYGNAAAPIRRFMQFTRQHIETAGMHPDRRGTAAAMGIGQAVADEGLNDFAEAMQLAQDDPVRARVEKASICAYRVAINPVWASLDLPRGTTLPFQQQVDADTAARMRPLVKQFFALCKKHGVTMASEHMTIGEAQTRIRAVLGLKDGEDW